jgi:hypothetical protein
MRSVDTLRFFRQLFAALTIAFAVPAFAYAATVQTTKTIDYATSIGPVVGFAVPYAGRLQIRTSAAGIITGYYRPADNNDFVPVTGAVDGNRVWMDIGREGGTRVNGTLANGKIVGMLVGNDGKIQRFTADDPQIER